MSQAMQKNSKSKKTVNPKNAKFVPRKGWPQRKFNPGFDGYLSNGSTFYKKISVTNPPRKPSVYSIEIRKFYTKNSKRSDTDGVYLNEREYNGLTSVLLMGRYQDRTYDLGAFDRQLIVSPNTNNGGVNLYQTTVKREIDEETGEEKSCKVQNRSIYLTSKEISNLITKYGRLQNFVQGYEVEEDEDEDDQETDKENEDEDMHSNEESENEGQNSHEIQM